MNNLHIHLDVVGGIAGDMFVACITDAFPQFVEPIHAALAQVLPKKAGIPSFWHETNGGIGAGRFDLKPLPKNTFVVDTAKVKGIGIVSKTKLADHHSDETTYRHLKNKIETSSLSTAVIEIAVDILTILAKSEAKIHCMGLDSVHFHELADWDSLMDVIAAAVLLDQLSNASWSVSKLPRGNGLVKTQHGLVPVPAPATAEILVGFDFIDDGISGERITPTGAAILKYIFRNGIHQAIPQSQLKHTGYGAGSKKMAEMPNILRALVFETEAKKQADTVIVATFDIDDMSGEEIADAADMLRSTQGVIDVSLAQVKGKKNRTSEQFCLLIKPEYKNVVFDACFLQTSTIGLRWRIESRVCLNRVETSQVISAENDNENYRIKTVNRPNDTQTHKIENDDLGGFSTLAKRRNIKYKTELAAQAKHNGSANK
ncbi:LarC family nickel insertion protein [Catenovulum maritimum]|uniref:LarC family nickel insertion protein n=1 Tax=Catenovulum maritimum TaxID=1513271 RepID=UPI00065FCEF3|nr:LarC family nickel insertion protein [Catenovulum maritimum]